MMNCIVEIQGSRINAANVKDFLYDWKLGVGASIIIIMFSGEEVSFHTTDWNLGNELWQAKEQLGKYLGRP